jgi:hypothetical protein
MWKEDETGQGYAQSPPPQTAVPGMVLQVLVDETHILQCTIACPSAVCGAVTLKVVGDP